MDTISIICISILLIVVCIMFFINNRLTKKVHHQLQLNIETKEQNEEIQKQNELLNQERLKISEEIAIKQSELNYFKELQELELQKQKAELNAALGSYADSLSDKYDEVEQYFDNEVCKIESEYTAVCEELDNIKSTRAALIEANRREELVKANPELFTLPLSPADRTDIQTLEKIKGQLNNPRILSMLIWSTFFQKPMTTLCNNILGTKVICGIYKITNLNTNLCYIGQAVDIATRWKTHCKCGLGIDTPQSNKLYKAMQEDGVWNFSWELLEECPQSRLNEKEAEYIEIYQSKDYGYNTQAGRKV